MNRPGKFGIGMLNGKFVVMANDRAGLHIVNADGVDADVDKPGDVKFFGMDKASASELAARLNAGA